MDISLNLDSLPQRARSPREGTSPTANLDWQGLAARLSAAYALRRVLAGKDLIGDTAPSGSFEPDVAGAIADFPGTYGPAPHWQAREASVTIGQTRVSGQTAITVEADVNPIALADLKAPSGIDTEVAGHTPTGDRGFI